MATRTTKTPKKLTQAATLALYEETLNKIAAWNDKGPPTSLDEPCSALQARDALRAAGRAPA